MKKIVAISNPIGILISSINPRRLPENINLPIEANRNGNENFNSSNCTIVSIASNINIVLILIAPSMRRRASLSPFASHFNYIC